MKYDRLLRLTALIDHIASLPGKNYQYYADKFRVSTRTIRRDVDTIAEAGLAVDTTAGIRFMNDIKLSDINFTYNQALALMVALSEVNRYLDFDGSLNQVKEKLAQTLPDKLLKVVDKIEKRIGIYPSTNQVALKVATKIDPLISCVVSERKLKIKYKSFSSKEIKLRKVEPYGLFFRRRGWYLAAFCNLQQEVRTFRLSRILDWEHLIEKFKYPQDFDLDQYVKESFELMRGEPVDIEVKFTPKVADLIKESSFNNEEEKKELEDGSILYRASVGGWKEVFFWILSFGGDAEILNPDWLKDKAKDEAKKMLEKY